MTEPRTEPRTGPGTGPRTELRVEGLTVRYRSGHHTLTAVDGVDLAVPAGQVLGLVGESGSGKSTLARAVVGMAPATGRVLLDGVEVTDLRGRDLRRRVQMVFQDPNLSLDPRMTAGEAIGEAAAAHRRLGRRERAEEVARLLDLVALDPAHAARLPRELSGGQRQRVALARALAVRPQVLIADEITSALDASVQGAILNLVRDIQTRLGLTVLFISHNLAVVRYVSDAIAVMYLGQVVEVAETEQLLATPHHPYTRALLDAVPQLHSGGEITKITAGQATGLLDTEPADPHNPPPGCHFHPRCPIGPLALPDRTVCTERDPTHGAALRPHHAACHFAEEAATGRTDQSAGPGAGKPPRAGSRRHG